jgi:CRP/FNR family transcriptional regulator, anaerobic regulatory protein
MPLGLTPDELKLLSCMAIEQRNFKNNEPLFRSEQPFTNLFAIRSGSFKTLTTTPSGLEHVVGFYLPGEWLGLHAIHRQRYAMTAIALETSAVCVIPYTELTTATQSIPSLQQYLFSMMSEKLHPDRHVDPNSTAENRIARLLLSLSQRYARRGYSPREFRLSMSREEIGR